MSRLEDELRQALRRREPPAGFAERVMARARASERDERRPGWLSWRWLAAATAVVVVAAGLNFMEERRRRLEGERAKEEVMLALELTGAKLLLAEQRVQQVIGFSLTLPN